MRTSHHNPTYPEFSGRLKRSYHLEMIRDAQRVNAIKSAIDALANKERTFLELGCGSGLFVKYAADKFSTAIGIEGDPVMYESAARLCGTSDGSTSGVMLGDAFELMIGMKFDVLLCEMLSTWMITEPQVPIVRRARSLFLNAGGHIVPRRVVNLFELGNFEFGNDIVKLPVAMPQFTGVAAPTIMTASVVAAEVDFESGNLDDEVNGFAEALALSDGFLNAARLSSIVDLAPGITFYSTDTLMPLTIAPLSEPCHVKRGDKLIFRYRYRHRTVMEDVFLSAEKC
jgi:predicted RNA methylase